MASPSTISATRLAEPSISRFFPLTMWNGLKLSAGLFFGLWIGSDERRDQRYHQADTLRIRCDRRGGDRFVRHRWHGPRGGRFSGTIRLQIEWSFSARRRSSGGRLILHQHTFGRFRLYPQFRLDHELDGALDPVRRL